MHRKYIFILALMVLVAVSQTAFASGPKLGTNAAPELLIPMGARNVAMGGANIANIQGTEAIYWNPAGLSTMSGGEASLTYMSYFADMSVSYIATGVNMGNIGALGLSLQVLSIGDIFVTTIEAPEGTGEMLKPNYLTLGLSYSKQFTDRINFGTNMKIISESIGNMRGNAIAFDFGLQYVSPWNVAFGVVLRNLGGNIQFAGTGIEFDSDVPFANPNATTRKTKLDMSSNELPTSMSMGLAYTYKLGDLQQLNVTGLYANNSFSIDQFTAGLEYGFKEMFFLRGGYSEPLYPDDFPANAKDDTQFGLTFGLGVQVPISGTTFKFDYAYRDMALFDANQYFTLGFSF